MYALLLRMMGAEQKKQPYSFEYGVQQTKNVLQNNMIQDLENEMCAIELKNEIMKQNSLSRGFQIMDKN